MSEQKNWKAVQMGSEGWTVFDTRIMQGGRGHDFVIASNLSKEDAQLIAVAPALEAKLEAMEAVVDAARQVRIDWLSLLTCAELEKSWPAMKRLDNALAAQQEKEDE